MSLFHYDVERHLPLITPRIEFRTSPRQPLPVITPRLEFQLDAQNSLRSTSSGTRSHAQATPQALNPLAEPPQAPLIPPAGPLQPPPRPERRPPQPPAASTAATSPVTLRTARGPPQPPTASTSTAATPSGPTATTTPIAKIPKPVGEPGRPGSGGFSLESTLTDLHSWSENEVEDLMTFLRKEAHRALNMSISFRAQKSGAINALCEKAMEDAHFPILKDYDKCWPVRSALKLILKYRSEASRRNEGRNTTRRVQQALQGDQGSSSSTEG